MNKVKSLISTAALASLLCACSTPEAKANDGSVIGAPSGAASAAPPSAPPAASASEVNPRLLRRFQPISGAAADAVRAEQAELGRMLFSDPRLSKSGEISCRSCHDLQHYGADGRSSSRGHEGRVGKRNAPSVYNAAASFAQFWDGRAGSVEEQAKGPILNRDEMAMAGADEVVRALKAIPGYVSAFRLAFPGEADPVTLDNVGRAIGAFERKLATPGRWDRFLRGDKAALTDQEKHGLKVFLDVGCMVCHTGPLVGGSMFERAGAVEPWPNQADRGREGVTRLAADRMMFKVPSLRNVEKTAPYFHDGSAATLEDAVRMMGKHQLGLELLDDEVAAIVSWLRSLTGEIPAEVVALPELPGKNPHARQ